MLATLLTAEQKLKREGILKRVEKYLQKKNESITFVTFKVIITSAYL